MALRSSFGCIIALLLAAGCAPQTYEPGYSYYPQPLTVDVVRRGSTLPAPLTVLVTILGVRNSDLQQQIPYSVAVRMRFENTGRQHVIFDPHTLELVTGTLQAFSPPVVEPPQTVELLPGQRHGITAYFPFPGRTNASQMNMRNLRLRWTVKIDDYPVPQTALFEQVNGGYETDSQLYY